MGRGPTRVEPEPDAGFHYPYYLHVPDGVAGDEPRPILVEPTNAWGPTDELVDLFDRAETQVESGTSRRIADELSVPFLHPVFPRPVSDPVDWTHYVHQLDAETMRIDDGPLERVDLQLLSMVEHARERLSGRGYATTERFVLDGFSSAGTFANRFAALHPGRLVSVTAGGLNGLAILPVEEAAGRSLPHQDVDAHTLNYPVGVADVEELTGDPFDLAAFREVNQFLYLGGDDDRDGLLYPDAWTDADLRKVAVLVYGEDVHDERFPYCREVYEEVGAAAVFRVYEGVGHTPEPAVSDLVEFHERSLAGDDVEDIRADLGGTAPG